jgi:phosphohistidine phosphatase
MKRLILLRHASAADAREDALRELTAEGREQASAAGVRIAALGADWQPAQALCSSARRASATLEAAREAITAPLAVQLDEQLYLASAARLLAALRRVPDATECVLVVAHEPGLSELARELARRGDSRARLRLAHGIKPGAFAAIALDVASWRELRAGCGELVALEPR